MKLLEWLRTRIATLFHRGQINAEMEDELRSHIQHRADEVMPDAHSDITILYSAGSQECGVMPDLGDPDATPVDADFARYQAFLAAGMQGEMTWLSDNAVARSRLDGDEILAGARSVVCVARRYPRDADNGDVSRSIARYARGHDYHRFLRRRVRRLASFIRSLGTPEHPVEARPLIDEKPVLERAWAARAGLGFVGKNGMLIVPGLGSLVMLGEVVTTLDLQAEDPPMAERCGSCTRCLEACPTQAFPRPFVLDARRCVSYLTIEHHGEIEPALREAGVDGFLHVGCDAVALLTDLLGVRS